MAGKKSKKGNGAGNGVKSTPKLEVVEGDGGTAPTPPAPAGPSRWIAAVRSNVKGGVACKLGPRVLIIGDNSSGKSSIVNAIELAETAKASDIAGRLLVSREADLMALAPGREGILFAQIAHNDGATSVFTCSSIRGTRKASHQVALGVDPDRVLPLRAVRDAILGSADTARRFFLKHAVGDVSVDDIYKRLPPQLVPVLDAVRIGGKTPFKELAKKDAVSALLGALEVVKDEARAKTTEANAAAKIVDAGTQGLAPEPTAAELEAAKQRIASAQSALTAVSLAATVQDARTRLAKVVEEGRQATTERAALAEALNALPELTQSDAGLKALIDVLTWMVATEVDHCVACGTPGIGATLPQRLEAAKLHTAAATGTVSRRLELSNRINALTNQLDVSRTVYEELSKQVALAEQASASATLETAKAELDAAQVEMARLTALAGQWTQQRTQRASGHDAGLRATLLKDLAKQLSTVVAALLDGAVGAFSSRVTSYLPTTDVFSLRLREGEREVLQLGLFDVSGGAADPEPEGVLRTALSGAEWARVTLAIAAAISEGYEGVTVLIPEDRAWHPRTLTEVLKALSNAPGQVILAHPTPPTEVPPGWQVIDVDAGQHKAMETEWGLKPPGAESSTDAGATATSEEAPVE